MSAPKKKLPKHLSSTRAYNQGRQDTQDLYTNILINRTAEAYSMGYTLGLAAGRYSEVVK